MATRFDRIGPLKLANCFAARGLFHRDAPNQLSPELKQRVSRLLTARRYSNEHDARLFVDVVERRIQHFKRALTSYRQPAAKRWIGENLSFRDALEDSCILLNSIKLAADFVH